MDSSRIQAILNQDFESTPIIDRSIFDGVKGIPGLMDEVVRTVNEKLLKMQAVRSQPMFTQEMLHEFGDIAHALKSGICMIGCSRLALLCAKMEVCGHIGAHQSGEMLVGYFDNHMNRILQETMTALEVALA